MRKYFGMAVVAAAALIYATAAFADGATVTHQDLSGTFSNDCNGELIDFTGDAVFVNHTVTRPNGSVRVTAHANTQGVSGIGQTTGAKYQLIETISLRETLTPESDTTSENLMLNVVGQGNVPNFFIHAVITVHFDFATGDTTVHIRQDRTSCH